MCYYLTHTPTRSCDWWMQLSWKHCYSQQYDAVLRCNTLNDSVSVERNALTCLFLDCNDLRVSNNLRGNSDGTCCLHIVPHDQFFRKGWVNSQLALEMCWLHDIFRHTWVLDKQLRSCVSLTLCNLKIMLPFMKSKTSSSNNVLRNILHTYLVILTCYPLHFSIHE